jgi:L-tartrate/succinate antiporter
LRRRWRRTQWSGGTVYPIGKNIPLLYGSFPDYDPQRIGGYLLWTGFATTGVTSSMFLTALAPNLLAVEIGRTVANVGIPGGMSGGAGFSSGRILLFAPTLLFLYPPQTKRGSRGRSVGWC